MKYKILRREVKAVPHPGRANSGQASGTLAGLGLSYRAEGHN